MSSRSYRTKESMELELQEENFDALENEGVRNGGYVPLEKDPTAVVYKAPDRSESQTKKNPMNTSTPTPINARKNIQRQEREQRTWSSILGSAATILMLCIVGVAALAGFGGYVMWKQIEKQSVTIAALETNLRKEMATQQEEFQKTAGALAKQLDSNKVQITALQAKLDEQLAASGSLRKRLDQQEGRIRQIDRFNQRMTALEENLEARKH